jgi:hypothetical protein
LPLAAFGSTEARSAPKADLWPLWEAHDPESTRALDHARWTDFLQRHVHGDESGVNRVAYARIPEQDRRDLSDYLKALAAMAVSTLNRAEQMAYWINLYNALTVKVILDHYPVESIRDIDISPGFFADGPWDKTLVTIEGVPISLNDIEHRILRPIWRDPRLHYALNCASLGCPNLQRNAFSAMNAPSLLDKAARDFINSPRGARIEDDQLTVSSIYIWFTEDFEGDTDGVIRHLKKFAAPDLAATLDDVTEIDDAYDWSLNDAATK